MIDLNNARARESAEKMHMVMQKKIEGRDMHKEDILLENRIFDLLCRKPDCQLPECAREMNVRYGYRLTGEQVAAVLRSRRVSDPDERRELLSWADKTAELFAGMASGDEESRRLFEEQRGRPALAGGRRHGIQDRMAALMLYAKYPELDLWDDAEHLLCLGTTLAKYFFQDAADALMEGKKSEYKEEGNPPVSGQQGELEERLEACRAQTQADLFSRMNSEKYGFLLDELLALQRGMGELKKNGVKLPVEISGLLILVRKLIRFVRESQVEPVMKVGSVREVSAADVEFCDYDGTPFEAGEKKRVQVLSPGWVCGERQIRISRPKVREVKELSGDVPCGREQNKITVRGLQSGPQKNKARCPG